MVSPFIVDFIVLGIFILISLIYLHRNKHVLTTQPLIAIGKFPIIAFILAKTGWGLKQMDYLATKFPRTVRFFGYSSIGLSVLGILVVIIQFGFTLYFTLTQPQVQTIELVLPFTEITGIGYLSFVQWLIAITLLVGVHEFAHGVVARAHNVKVQSSGVGFGTLLKYLPVIPLAFVEPDPSEFPKTKNRVQYSVLAAGPGSNIILGFIFVALNLLAMSALSSMGTADGFYFGEVPSDYPAALSGIEANQVYHYYNGEQVSSFNEIYIDLQSKEPGDVISFGYEQNGELIEKSIVTTTSPFDNKSAYIGVAAITNNVLYEPVVEPYIPFFKWVIQLLYIIWLFNFGIGLINLAPLFMTDGGQMSRLFCYQIFKKKSRAERVYRYINFLFLIILLLGLFAAPLTSFLN